MRSAGRWSFLVLAMVVGLVFLFPASATSQDTVGGINKKSHNGKDHVDITKITPRVAADLPTPVRLPFSMELTYRLESAAKGKLRVGVFRWRQGTSTKRPSQGKLASGLEPLVKTVEREIKKGRDVVTITTEAANLTPPEGINSQVIVVVNMQDDQGKETCWATSYNFLRGSLVSKPDTAPAHTDAIQVLSFDPKAGSLKTGNDYEFQVNLKYHLKSQSWGYINLELGEGSLQSGWAPWYTAVVPVSQGTGLLRVKTRPFFLPAVAANRQLKMLLPFRVQPLGGTVQVLTGGPWTLAAQGSK